MNVPILKVIVSKDQFSAVNKILPAHEFPIWLSIWGSENLEIVGKTGMHGEAMQIKCRIKDGANKGQVITRNCVGPIRIGDIIQLRETAREADSIGGR